MYCFIIRWLFRGEGNAIKSKNVLRFYGYPKAILLHICIFLISFFFVFHISDLKWPLLPLNDHRNINKNIIVLHLPLPESTSCVMYLIVSVLEQVDERIPPWWYTAPDPDTLYSIHPLLVNPCYTGCGEGN